MVNEIWKSKPGYEGLYEVSDRGRVKSLDRYEECNGFIRFRKERILKTTNRGNGYLVVGLYKDGKHKLFSVHRLVAEVFIPNPENLPQVNHINEDKTDNRVENLEWCSEKYNTNYGTRNEKISKRMSKPVLQFTRDSKFVREWSSTQECERNGYNHSFVSACCRGKYKTAYGHIWKYK